MQYVTSAVVILYNVRILRYFVYASKKGNKNKIIINNRNIHTVLLILLILQSRITNTKVKLNFNYIILDKVLK